MLKCKRCHKRVPTQHKDEFNEHDSLCRKCWHIKHSKWKDVKNKASDLAEKESDSFYQFCKDFCKSN